MQEQVVVKKLFKPTANTVYMQDAETGKLYAITGDEIVELVLEQGGVFAVQAVQVDRAKLTGVPVVYTRGDD